MAAIPVTSITRDGVADPAATAGSTIEDHTVPNGGNMFLEVTNTDAASQTFEINVPGSIDGLAVPNRSYTLAAGASRKIGDWPVSIYGNELTVTAMSAATLEFRAFSV